MTQAPRIVWFKRDLRINDHAPLLAASQSNAPIIPLYIVEPEYWKQPFASRRHWHFIHDSLCDLGDDLAELGQHLIIKVGDACEVIKKLHLEHQISDLYAHEETGNLWTFQRDIAVQKLCLYNEIALHESPSNGVVRRLRSRDNWSRIRNARLAEKIRPKPKALVPLPLCKSDTLPEKNNPMFGNIPIGKVQKGGRKHAVADLRSFLNHRSREYLYHISAPDLSEFHCSRLSAHLTWGTLSVREVAQSIVKRRSQLSPEENKSFGHNLTAFGSRLAWRCHYIQKIEDQPEIETHCMHPAFEGLRVNEHNDAHFQAWANGQTGYPFVDACMRNLTTEGWITFRMRAMLVSFASYQLWLDWRITAQHLARLFTDYEPGIHYSQLQMQSGVTGINAMRVYNPIKQSMEQDPTGSFIRKWMPELKRVPDEFIHEPWKYEKTLTIDSGFALGQDYPAPIVDQTASARSAKEKISNIRNEQGFRLAANAVFLKLGSRKPASKRKNKLKSQDTTQLSLF
jgi:deoxyribodipyrimidine photo-lyase